MKSLVKLVLCTALILFGAAAKAADSTKELNFSVGAVFTDICDSFAPVTVGAVSAQSCSEDTGFQGMVGFDYVHKSHLLLGAEAGYGTSEFTITGTVSGLPATGSADFESRMAGGRIGGAWLDNRLKLYARVGYHSWEVEIIDGNDLYYGAAIGYDFYQSGRFKAGVRVDATRYEVSRGEVDTLGLNIVLTGILGM